MKKTILGLTILTTILASCSNGSSSHLNANGVDTMKVKYHEGVFNQAFANNDIATAIAELNHILYLDSSRVDYMDSIARYYLLDGNLIGAKKYADIVVEKQPDNLDFLEVAALIDQQANNPEAAISKLRKLYNSKKDAKYLYSIAANQLSIENYSGVDATIDELKAHPEFSTKAVKIDFQANDGGVQFIPLDAATYYLEGFRYAQSGNKQKALEGLNQALKINPNFQRAQLIARQVMQME